MISNFYAFIHSFFFFLFFFFFFSEGNFRVTVNSVIVEDHYTKSSKFRKIIQPVDSSFSSSSFTTTTTTTTNNNTTALVPLKGGEGEGEGEREPWFCVDFSLHPLDVVADYIFKLKVFFFSFFFHFFFFC